MTTHENTRSRHLDILAHHRSSQRAAINTAQQLPARRPSGHGYLDEDVLPDAERLAGVGDITDLEAIQDTERHLLYVAATRARDHLLLTGIEPGSEFLDDLAL